MKIGNKVFDFDKHAYIMGILNVTPDSFSDGGKYNEIDTAKRHVGEMLECGADIIDIGGESTRPGHQKISVDEELSRVIPIIEMIRKEFDCVISIDTTKAKVAEAAIRAGANLINDVWGLKADEQIANVIAKYGVPCCLMHNRNESNYSELIKEVMNDLEESIAIGIRAGIKEENMIIDPGIGFGKSLHDNLNVMKHLAEFCTLGYPILLGTSRKSMIGLSLELPKDERVEGTIATTIVGYCSGARIFRVHDVKENKRALKMAEAIYSAQ